MQKENGIIGGWHGDGNFARTTVMYCLWKTQGLTVNPWRDDIVLGAVCGDDGKLNIYLRAEKDWSGTLCFDLPRHKTTMKLPLDWPRINQFPQWYTVEPGEMYIVSDSATGKTDARNGTALHKGFPIKLQAGQALKLCCIPAPASH
jgi:hypothetical protein